MAEPATAVDDAGTQMGVDALENNTGENLDPSAQPAGSPPISDDDDDLDDDDLDDDDEEEEEESQNDAPSLFARLKTGFSGGVKAIKHKLLSAIYQDSNHTTELPLSITETCQLILDAITKFNNNMFIQEKWLDETEYLLQKKTLTIGVFGRHKAGKSTLLNALLYHEVLPATVTNETAFILRIHHNPSSHHKISCFEDTEQSLSMKNTEKGEIKGCRNIQKAIHKRNSDIRQKTETIDIAELMAHIPFLCHCSTGDINIVLLDSPGLSESNDLGISEVSEYQLMTCSAYVYVISGTQLEDSIDTASLRAIVNRDPKLFVENRCLIAVTRLDEYEIPDAKFDDKSGSNDSDESSQNESDLDKCIAHIRKKVQDQCKSFVSIPDDCIIPLCATGALEARKEKLGEKRSKEMKVLMAKLDVSTIEEVEEVSQVTLLEKKLSDFAGKVHYLWLYNIVMDCTRYCEQAQKKLDEAKEKLMEREKKLKNMVKDKKKVINDFETQAEYLNNIYKKDSEFSKELVTAFDKDLEKTNDKIENISKLHFQKFRSRIKEMKGITTEQFNLEAEDFFRQENDLLKNDLLDLPFMSVQKAVGESINALASARGDMKQCMALYCNTVCTSTKVKSNLPEAGFISESVCNDTTAVSTTPPIKLKDLLEQSQVHYSILKKIMIFLTGWLLKFPKWTRTIDEFLDELEKYFLADCHEYFTKIKPAIVESYRKKYSKTAEDDIEDVKKQFSEEKKAMDTLVKKWNKRAKRNKKKAKSYSDLIDTLEKQKVHLVSLAQRAHGISLSAVSQT